MMKKSKLHPWFLTGLIDAEGSLGINITKDIKRKSGFIITLFLEIGLNIKDKNLIENLKFTLGVGNIYYKSSDNTYRWKVSNIEELSSVIIPHLIAYPLLSQKRADFELFSKILEIIKRKDHLNYKGLQEIVNIKSSLNKGINDNLRVLFPNSFSVNRQKINFNEISDPHWLSGFITGEGCFFCKYI